MKRFFIGLCIIFLFIGNVSAIAIEDISSVLPSIWQEDISFFSLSQSSTNALDIPFQDKFLSLYLQKAISNNFSIKIAEDRILQYNELSKKVNAQRLPWLSISPTVNTQRNLQTSSNTYTKNELYNLPLNLNWELDILGKNKQKFNSSKLDIEIKKLELYATKLSVTKNLEISYYNLLLTDFLIQNSQNIISNLKETIKLKEQLYNGGIISYDDIYLTKLEYSKEIEQLNQYKIQNEVFKHQIQCLLGNMSNSTENIERENIKNIQIPQSLPLSLPEILMTNRPDVLIAKTELDKAHIDVKVAQKEFYPTIYLNELIGLSTINFSDLFNWYSRIYQLGGQIVQDLYTGGYKTANLKYNRAVLKEKLHNYYNTLLLATKEAEDGLSNFNNDYRTYKNYEKVLKESKHFEQVISVKYSNGLSSKIDYLSAQRQVFVNENLYTTYKCKSIIDLINLSKVFGS